MRLRCVVGSVVFLSIVIAVAPSLAHAQSKKKDHAPNAGPTRIDPRLDALFAHLARTGETLPLFVRSARLESERRAPVTIRFAHAPTSERLSALERDGVHFRHDRQPVASGAYSAEIEERALGTWAAPGVLRAPDIARVECELFVRGPRPLEASNVETTVTAARRAIRSKDGTLLDGKGIVIGDIDTGLFVFHPALFRADGGAYRWVDVNGDGELTPRVDGVDLDENGTIEPSEILQILSARAEKLFGGGEFESASDKFRPERDYLYLDTNGNHARDFGKTFAESDPAYGEPVFLLDDANRNGAAELSEKLLRLGTSKVRGVLAEREFTRGGGGKGALVQYDLGDKLSESTAGHATGAVGILLAGELDRTLRTGLAPGAELLLHTNQTSNDGSVSAVQWMMDRGANVILTEFAPYAGVTLDGSSELEQMLDAASARGIVPVSPAGNLAKSGKHKTMSITAASADFALRTDASLARSRYLGVSLHHRTKGRTISGKIVLPDSREIDLSVDTQRGELGGGLFFYVMSNETPRGTLEKHIALTTTAIVPSGNYVLKLAGDAGDPIVVDGYVQDDVNSWGGGFVFADPTETRTICHPATSDKTIAVAAYTLHDGSNYSPYGPKAELARYSSQGPRIDGDPGIDISAPDNPLSLGLPGKSPDSSNTYAVFGGTSGAGPHVAAAAALMKQLDPKVPTALLKTRLLEGARRDSHVTSPELWGAGKLDLAKALGLTAQAGDGPTVKLVAAEHPTIGASTSLKLEIKGATGAVRARWDLDYDGKPDTEWDGALEHVVAVDNEDPIAIKVEIIDDTGILASDTARIVGVRAAPSPNPPPNQNAAVATPPSPNNDGCRASPSGENYWSLVAIGGALIAISARRRMRITR